MEGSQEDGARPWRICEGTGFCRLNALPAFACKQEHDRIRKKDMSDRKAKQREIDRRLHEGAHKHQEYMNELLDLNRYVLLALRDHGAHRFADKLDEQLQRIDKLSGEMNDLIKQDPRNLLNNLLSKLTKHIERIHVTEEEGDDDGAKVDEEEEDVPEPEPEKTH